MEIKQIKEQLTIARVLQHYNLQPDKNHRLNCPFHDDKNPSLQIYHKTNTYCCFSSSCAAGTGDAIQFIERKENCGKHEALLKATALLDGNTLTSTAKLFIAAGSEVPPSDGFREAKIAVLTKLFKYFSRALPLTKKSVDYLEGRSINYKLHEVGCNAGDWHHKLNEKNFIASCEEYGLLKAKPAGGFTVWAKDCIIFPLKNIDNKIISLYARSTINDKEQRHFYLQNREGLYPGYPGLHTKKLILCESIIDAASLLQQGTIKSNYTILSLFGTNGLTDEHQQSIVSLPQLEEIILMLDADEAGEAAAAKHYSTLKVLLPHIRITHTNLPAGEDVNSVLCTHDDAGVLQSIIDERTDFLFQLKRKTRNHSCGQAKQTRYKKQRTINL